MARTLGEADDGARGEEEEEGTDGDAREAARGGGGAGALSPIRRTSALGHSLSGSRRSSVHHELGHTDSHVHGPEHAHGPEFTAVRAGGTHCVALTAAGEVYAWGKGAHGVLGLGGVGNVHVPAAVDLNGRHAIAVASGEAHCIAVVEESRRDLKDDKWFLSFAAVLPPSSTSSSQPRGAR